MQMAKRNISRYLASAAEGAKTLVRDEQGATMVEYGLMVALIAIVCITAVTNIGTDLNLVFSDIAASL
nr:Flp family type IVb pilin [Trinickia caryophylli]